MLAGERDTPPRHRRPVVVTLFALLAGLVLFCAGFVFRQTEEGAAARAQSGPGVPAADEVRGIQADLGTLDFYDREVTGRWDTATVAALMSFQRWAGLEADGVWGPRTAAAIQAALDNDGPRTGISTAQGRGSAALQGGGSPR